MIMSIPESFHKYVQKDYTCRKIKYTLFQLKHFKYQCIIKKIKK